MSKEREYENDWDEGSMYGIDSDELKEYTSDWE